VGERVTFPLFPLLCAHAMPRLHSQLHDAQFQHSGANRVQQRAAATALSGEPAQATWCPQGSPSDTLLTFTAPFSLVRHGLVIVACGLSLPTLAESAYSYPVCGGHAFGA